MLMMTFTFDIDGNAYVAVHSYSAVQVTPSENQTTCVVDEGVGRGVVQSERASPTFTTVC
jgi:hypothetical protein